MTGTIEAQHTAPAALPFTEIKSYVGKADLAEALVTGWRSDCDAVQTVTAQWPRTHDFYTPTPDRHSPLLFTECVRQSLAVVAHAVHQIPVGYRMGWEYFRSDVAAEGLRTRGEAAEMKLVVTHTEVTRRRMGSVHLTGFVEATLHGEHLGCAEVHYSAHPPAIYNRLRGPYADAHTAFSRALPPGPALSPARVGRASARDVVLSPTADADQWELRVDTRNSVLFDHPHDHIPGMVLLEAVAQSAQAQASPRVVIPVGFDTTFFRYAELDAPCLITAEYAEPDLRNRPRLLISARQGDRPVFSSLVTVEPVAGL